METTKFVPSPTSDVWLGVAQLGVRGEPPLRRGVGEPIMAFTGDFGQGNGSKHCSWPQRFFCKYLIGHDLLYNYSILLQVSQCVGVWTIWIDKNKNTVTGFTLAHICGMHHMHAHTIHFPLQTFHFRNAVDLWTCEQKHSDSIKCVEKLHAGSNMCTPEYTNRIQAMLSLYGKQVKKQRCWSYSCIP